MVILLNKKLVNYKGLHLPISLLHLIQIVPDVSEFTIKECFWMIYQAVDRKNSEFSCQFTSAAMETELDMP